METKAGRCEVGVVGCADSARSDRGGAAVKWSCPESKTSLHLVRERAHYIICLRKTMILLLQPQVLCSRWAFAPRKKCACASADLLYCSYCQLASQPWELSTISVLLHELRGGSIVENLSSSTWRATPGGRGSVARQATPALPPTILQHLSGRICHQDWGGRFSYT